MEVFDVFDSGLSQSRGFTLFEICKSQFNQLYHLKSQRNKDSITSNDDLEEPTRTPELEVDKTLDNITDNAKATEEVGIKKELKYNVDEAIACLESEIQGSYGANLKSKLLELKSQLSDLFKI